MSHSPNATDATPDLFVGVRRLPAIPMMKDASFLSESVSHSSVASYIDSAVTPYVHRKLISHEALDSIRMVASSLPGSITGFFGFECPLFMDQACADLLICARADEGAREILLDCRSNPAFRIPSEAARVWEHLLAFHQALVRPSLTSARRRAQYLVGVRH